MVRFIHCADLHFDRSFEGISAIQEQQGEFLDYNRQTLQAIVDLAVTEAVDFVLFAGDTFHQNRPTLRTQRLFFEQMNRLAQQDILVYLCFGNHDYYEASRYWFDFPKNVILYTSEDVRTIEGVTKEQERYAISAFSYTHKWLEASKVPEFPQRYPVDVHLGMYHGEVGSKHYAPFQPTEMQTKGYDYWALGHIHVPTVVMNQPPIRYAGAPIGHTRKETQTVGVLLVSIQRNQPAKITEHPVAGIDWQTYTCSLKGMRTKKEALAAIEALTIGARPCFYRVVVTDTELLPENWLTPVEKREVIAYINQQKGKQHHWLYELQLAESSLDRAALSVPIEADEWQKAYSLYQQADIFNETIRELWTQSTLKAVVSKQEFHEAVLERVAQRLAAEFEGGKH